MRKYLISTAIIFSLAFPAASVFAIVVDSSTYTAPATVTFSSGNTSFGAQLYRDGSSSYVWVQQCDVIHDTSHVLNGYGTCGTGSFDGTIPDTYHLLQANSPCTGTYAACQALGYSGAIATFTINAAASTTPPVAPINNRTSTATVAGNVTSELIAFPLFILKTYGGPLTWMAIIFALVGAIYGIIKLVKL